MYFLEGREMKEIREWWEVHWAQKETISDLYKEIDKLKDDVKYLKQFIENHTKYHPNPMQKY